MGKSVFLDDIIVSLMYKNTPEDIKFIMLDPKKIELGEYNGIKYLLTGKSVSEKTKGYELLTFILKLLEARINTLAKTNHRSIEGYNKDNKEKWPHVFLFVDEGSEIIKMKDSYKIFEKILNIEKIAGLHLIFATNSYLKDYVNSNFLDKFKYRMTFDLASVEQAKLIDIDGSSWLKSGGEAIIKSPDGDIYKFKTPLISDNEINDAVIASSE